MAIWKESASVRKDPPIADGAPTDTFAPEPARVVPLHGGAETRESLIAREIAIEGKIEGSGHVRIAGRFKGDVKVQGSVTVESGAKVTGGVRADTVTVGGDVDGNVESASRVELLSTGVLNGDLKAASLTVAAGSRMRGQVEFGWDERTDAKPVARVGGSAGA